MASSINSTNNVYNFKVVLLGEGCVGKTSVALRYVENKFNDRHISTLQVPKFLMYYFMFRLYLKFIYLFIYNYDCNVFMVGRLSIVINTEMFLYVFSRLLF